ncbi:alpha/beta hydrolase [Sphingobacterium sp. FBM7-1]|uniref:alpha/beta hydrolase n=1 Tax=Sphingobacterium sp. FBM7-1 TaxID=2886688 RepID=UPI001D110D5A|nr:alpha/beta hydrolase [Sphingobacterium sp. FBM7-1]MCC2600168.1 alpha/beta hydrolase [Sphingobacterium sp. FBM7-1]
MKKIAFILLFIISWSYSNAQIDTVTHPANFSKKLNVEYAKVNDWVGLVDIYFNATNPSPTPIVINIHGGGWNKGSKETQRGFGSWFKNDIAVANMGYRLSQIAPAPAAIEDVRAVIAYVKYHAKELNIDPNKVIIMGGSAGGHLALMGGLLGNDKRFDKNCLPVEDMRVAAVIDKYGITEVKAWKSKSAQQWLGENHQSNKFIASVSPISYVNENTPPIFIVHGDADPIVPIEMSYDLQKKLDGAKVYHELYVVKDGLHGKFPKEENQEISKRIMLFIKKLNII